MTVPTVHELKCWPEPYQALLRGKTHEVRKADRDYKVGDILQLREFKPCLVCSGTGRDIVYREGTSWLSTPCCPEPHGEYTGRWMHYEVTNITAPGTFGLPRDILVMSVRMALSWRRPSTQVAR